MILTAIAGNLYGRVVFYDIFIQVLPYQYLLPNVEFYYSAFFPLYRWILYAFRWGG